MPTNLVRQGRNPYEVTVAVAIIALTVWAVLRGESSSVSVQQAMDRGQQLLWMGLAAAGSVATLIGLYWRKRPLSGLLIEQSGQLMLAFAVAAYLVVLCTVSTFERSGLVMSLGSAVCIGAGVRVVIIWRGVRLIRRAVERQDRRA